MAGPKRVKARIVGLQPFRVVALDVENGQRAYHRSALPLSDKFTQDIDLFLKHVGAEVEVQVENGEILKVKLVS